MCQQRWIAHSLGGAASNRSPRRELTKKARLNRTLTSYLNVNNSNVIVHFKVRMGDGWARYFWRISSVISPRRHHRIRVRPFDGSKRLPAFIERTYNLFEARIVGKRCVILAARETPATPSEIARHVSLVRSTANTTVVFAAMTMTAHNRSRLIGQGISFIVPGKQLHIPVLSTCESIFAHRTLDAPRAFHQRVKRSYFITCCISMLTQQRHRQSRSACITPRCRLDAHSRILWR